jgi:hypothetical protein
MLGRSHCKEAGGMKKSQANAVADALLIPGRQERQLTRAERARRRAEQDRRSAERGLMAVLGLIGGAIGGGIAYGMGQRISQGVIAGCIAGMVIARGLIWWRGRAAAH